RNPQLERPRHHHPSKRCHRLLRLPPHRQRPRRRTARERPGHRLPTLHPQRPFHRHQRQPLRHHRCHCHLRLRPLIRQHRRQSHPQRRHLRRQQPDPLRRRPHTRHCRRTRILVRTTRF